MPVLLWAPTASICSSSFICNSKVFSPTCKKKQVRTLFTYKGTTATLIRIFNGRAPTKKIWQSCSQAFSCIMLTLISRLWPSGFTFSLFDKVEQRSLWKSCSEEGNFVEKQSHLCWRSLWNWYAKRKKRISLTNFFFFFADFNCARHMKNHLLEIFQIECKIAYLNLCFKENLNDLLLEERK